MTAQKQPKRLVEMQLRSRLVLPVLLEALYNRKVGRLWSCKSAGVGVEGAMVTAVIPNPACGQWSYLECGHGWVPAIPVYGVELGRVVELMVQLRMSFASVHHFLEGKRGRDSNKNEPNRKIKKKQK